MMGSMDPSTFQYINIRIHIKMFIFHHIYMLIILAKLFSNN